MTGSEGLSPNDKSSVTTRTVSIKLGLRYACFFSVYTLEKSRRTVPSILSN